MRIYTLRAERHASKAARILGQAVGTALPHECLPLLQAAAGQHVSALGAIAAAIANLPAHADTEGS